MNFEFPADDGPLDPSWTAPLDTVADRLAPDEDDLLHHFDPGDFMIMARLVRPPRPTILIYKHYFTRGSLHLDASGQAYRYIEPKGTSNRPGRHVRQRLDKAIWALGLEQLPWLKPGLEHEQHGLTYDRWRLLPAARRAARRGPARSTGSEIDEWSELPRWSELAAWDEPPEWSESSGLSSWSAGSESSDAPAERTDRTDRTDRTRPTPAPSRRGGARRGHLHVVRP